MSVHQRTTRVTRIDGSVGLDELSRLSRVSGIRVRTIQGTHDAARHRKAEAKWIAERQNSLSRVEGRRVSPGNVWEILAFDFDHGKVRQRIRPDEFGR